MAYNTVDYDAIEQCFRRVGTVKGVHRELGYARTTISKSLKSKGYPLLRGAPRRRAEVGYGLYACSRCLRILPDKDFPRSNKTRLTYCKVCRTSQMRALANSSPERYIRAKYGRTKLRAAKAGIPFTVTWDEFWDLWCAQDGKCFYTGIDMVWCSDNGQDPNRVSIDKIEPPKGYTSGNIVFCSNRVNTIKHDMSLEELRNWLPSWHARVLNKGQGDF